jgi:hypothetical protein
MIECQQLPQRKSASQFLTKQFQVGVVGYVYKEIGCDSGSGDRVGCFQSQVAGVGPQLGFIFPRELLAACGLQRAASAAVDLPAERVTVAAASALSRSS